MASVNRRLRIALLSYRSKPHSGGQGVYVRHLSRELAALGHHVEVFSGQPYPELDDGPLLRRVPSLDLYRDDDPFRTPRPAEIRGWADALEVAMMWGGAFPEPLTFSVRALRALRARPGEFDIVHDNQGLGYGMLGVRRLGLPLVTSIHHPITVDRRLDMADRGWLERLNKARWYGFVRMQGRVARRVGPLITVSESSRDDICRDFRVPNDKVRIIPLGVDTRLFRPRPEQPRVRGRIVTVTSADSPLKGLSTLLRSVAKLATERDAHLVVVGSPSSATREQVALLALGDKVTFANGLPDEDYAQLLASAEVAVIPSLYEGFSLPAVEHLASGTPLVASRAGALPEVVGDAAVLVEPGDPEQLASALRELLDDGTRRAELADRGLARGRDRDRRALLERHQRRTRVLTVDFTKFPINPGDRVLDLGCGAGRHAFEAYRRGARVIAADLDVKELSGVSDMFAAMLAEGETAPPAQAAAVAADATRLPFADGSFDVVIVAEILEHVPNDTAALREVARVLRPGGTIAVTVPAWLPERICWALSTEYHEVPGGHVRIFTRAELTAKLAAAGLAPTGGHHAHGLHAPYWWLKCAVGVHDDAHPAVRGYHQLLVWDIMRKPPLTRLTEAALNPVIGKSLVIYARKEEKPVIPNGRVVPLHAPR